MSTERKWEKLQDILRRKRRVVVAFSGGVDSSLLLRVAVDTLGKANVLAVTAVSPTYPAAERRESAVIARKIGARQVFLKTSECRDASFLRNTPQRCFYCKKELFSLLTSLAAKRGFPVVVEATNLDDAADFRPGEKAKGIYSIVSPLREAGFTKQEIRRLARKLGLPNWNKPSMACLASRIPYGSRITPVRLKRIERAEDFLRKNGFRTVRVRDYGTLARIEVDPKDLSRILVVRAAVSAALKALGYRYVTLDLEGFRTGSMNEVLGTHRK